MLSASLASSFETTMLMPTPMLNVLNISRSQISPAFEIKYRQNFYRRAVYLRAERVGDASRDVFVEAAARDVGYALDLYLFEQGENGLYIYLCRREQSLADALAAELVNGEGEIAVFNIKNFSHEREAV